MRTVIFIPPLSWVSGGLAAIYRLALALHELGYALSLTSTTRNVPGLANLLERGIGFLPWQGLKLNRSDLWLVPESHPNALAVGLHGGARILVYVQNWYYLLSSLPENVYWEQLPVEFLAVSHPVAWFMEKSLRLRVRGILPPAVAQCFFQAEQQRAKHLRIAFMPRKNAALGRQMREVATAALGPGSRISLEWVPLDKRPLEEVARELALSHIFLSTGFPEGFGLPPAEAMAAGCIPVGFTGFGGWEYARPAKINAVGVKTPLLQPPCDLPYDLAPNGFYVADGDTLAGGLALAGAIRMFQQEDGSMDTLRACALEAAALFTEELQKKRVQQIWAGLEQELPRLRPDSAP